MNRTLKVTGAYGRKVDLAQWHLGYDFKIMLGPYVSIRDRAQLIKDGFVEVKFYNPDSLEAEFSFKL